MLLADGIDPNVQHGIAYAIVGLAGVVVGRIFDFLSVRHNGRLTALEKSAADCEKAHKLCEAERERDKAELKARDDADKAELQAQIAELRKQVNGK